jgi:hypothetical protein
MSQTQQQDWMRAASGSCRSVLCTSAQHSECDHEQLCLRHGWHHTLAGTSISREYDTTNVGDSRDTKHARCPRHSQPTDSARAMSSTISEMSVYERNPSWSWSCADARAHALVFRSMVCRNSARSWIETVWSSFLGKLMKSVWLRNGTLAATCWCLKASAAFSRDAGS